MTATELSPARPLGALTAKVRNRLRMLPKRLKKLAQTRAPRNWIAAQLHRQFVSDELSREAAAVAAGQLRFVQDHRREAASYYQLRRNIHRLEKGLIMRPRRDVFATRYIGDTVSLYRRLRNFSDSREADNPEMRWASSVLTAYFEAVDLSNPRIAEAFARFEQAPPAEIAEAPYKRDLSAPPPVDFDAFMALSRRRRSVRWYKEEPVSRDLIDKAITAAAQAPSACNRQPFMFRVFDDPDLARKIAAIPMGTKGFRHQLPVVVVVVGRLRAYPFERDRHAIYVDGSLAAMSFMFALETLGIASCPINWPDQEPHESQMRAALKLDADERVVMLVALGWPDPEGMVPYSAKRPLSELRTYNQ